MDVVTIGAALALCKAIPGTAAERAETAQAAAESAATLAQQHSMGFVDDGTGLILQPIEEGE